MGLLRSSATRRLAAVAIALASLAACGADEPDEGAAAPAVEAEAAASTPLAFEAPAVGGGTIDFEALAGKPTALWFWAPY